MSNSAQTLTTFTVTLSTDVDCAITNIVAATPENALAQARAICADPAKLNTLNFEPYSGPFPVNKIIVETESGGDFAEWLDDDLLLRQAAPDLLAALGRALTALNTAPRFKVPALDSDSYAVAAECETAIAMTKGGAA